MVVQDNSSSSDADDVIRQTEAATRARVLLAEDDRALRRLLGVMLERAGYKVIPAADGLEAMKIALSVPIDIVVTDAMMPNLSGRELCRFLRNSEPLSHIPVILLSGVGRIETDQDMERVDAFLTKPVLSVDLVACIERLLARKSE
jgi:CheY-like chemotaxis protein